MTDWIWKLEIAGKTARDGAIYYFEKKPTKLQCEQRMVSVGGKTYALTRIANEGHRLDPLT